MRVAIVGGGASGLACAIMCAKAGVKASVFEASSRCASKILASGNGRCNITNIDIKASNYHSSDQDLVKSILQEFGYSKQRAFFESMGLLLDVVADGRVFPISYEAKSVANTLIEHAQILGVELLTNHPITSLDPLLASFDLVVVATGSKAATGSDEAYTPLADLGCQIVSPYPALVQLHTTSDLPKKMSGVRLSSTTSLVVDGKKAGFKSGDLLFTHYGLSGLVTLDLSQKASLALEQKRSVEMHIDLLPSLDAQKLAWHLQRVAKETSLPPLSILSSILPHKVASVVVGETKQIDAKSSKRIAHFIKDLRFEISQTHGFKHAEVCGGGVELSEVDPKTLRAKRNNRVYICGEALDVVGDRGGYNFAFAWASAHAVARDVIKRAGKS